jgi:hypothetical protein
MLTYLASPYSHIDPYTRQYRFEQASKAMAELMLEGHLVYSPIAMTHHAAVNHGLPYDFQFWRSHCEAFLAVCSSMIVLQLPGWEQSVGVNYEIEWMLDRGLDVEYRRWKE